MKTNFSPQFNLNPALAMQAGAGVIQGIAGLITAKKTQKALEKLQTPQYTQNKSILDYYNTALSRYNVSPTDSAMYKRNMQGIGRNTATALNSLQDRRSGLAGASSILRAQNDSSLNANVAAEQEQNQRFGALGNAANMKTNEDDKAFQFNQIAPYEKKYNLLSMKAGAANQMANAGMSNIFGALQNRANMQMLDKEYGTNNKTGGTTGVFGTGANRTIRGRVR